MVVGERESSNGNGGGISGGRESTGERSQENVTAAQVPEGRTAGVKSTQESGSTLTGLGELEVLQREGERERARERKEDGWHRSSGGTERDLGKASRGLPGGSMGKSPHRNGPGNSGSEKENVSKLE